MQPDELISSRDSCPGEEGREAMCPGLEQLAELVGEPSPELSLLWNVRRFLRRATIMPPIE
jgi:hypothetical protein